MKKSKNYAKYRYKQKQKSYFLTFLKPMKKFWKNRKARKRNLLLIFTKIILLLLRDLSKLSYKKDWSLEISRWPVKISIIISWNPSGIDRQNDEKIYFIMMISVYGIIYAYAYDRPYYQFYTTDPFYNIECEFEKWKYDWLIRKLLKQVSRELKYGILTDFVRI